MAAAHPEGEVFFLRSSLELDSWDINNASHFYSHFLIEWVSNEASAQRQGGEPPRLTHARSTYGIARGTGVPDRQWRYGFWEHLPVGLGPTINNRRRNFRIPLQNVANRFGDRRKGGPQVVWVQPCPMPDRNEVWAWIDLLAPIRALYLPLSYEADSEFRQFCSYVQINFYHQSSRRVWFPQWNQFLRHEFSTLMGLGYDRHLTFGIDTRECIKLLGLPPKLRVTSIWDERLVVLHSGDNSRPSSFTNLPRLHFDFVDFINANFGVELTWKPVPANNSFLLNLIEQVVTRFLGMIPAIGPLLSAGFSAAWLAVTDPEEFRDWARSGGWLPDVIQAMMDSRDSMEKYVHENFRRPPRLRFQQALPQTEDQSEDQGEVKDEKEVHHEPKREDEGEGKSAEAETPASETELENIPPNAILLAGLRTIAFSCTNRSRSRAGERIHYKVLSRALRCGAISELEAAAIQEGLDETPEDEIPGEDEDRVEEVEEDEGQEERGEEQEQ